jgi:hypothetical protein
MKFPYTTHCAKMKLFAESNHHKNNSEYDIVLVKISKCSTQNGLICIYL